MNHLPIDGFPEGWLKYGIPSEETVILRNKIRDLLWQALEKKGIKSGVEEWRRMSVTAGAEILFIKLIDSPIAEHRTEIEKIVRDNLPKGYSYELTYG
jgi:hypothetical protein